MQKHPVLAAIIDISIPCGIVLGIIVILFAAFSRHAEAKYQPSPATLEMTKNIRADQEFVRVYEPKVLDAKQNAQVYRDTICKTDKGACTKEFLDPLNSGVDLSAFLTSAAR